MQIHPQLEKYCCALLNNSDDAKELMSETIAIGFEKFVTLRDKSRFKYFLFGIASNLFKKKITRRKNFVPLDDVDQTYRFQYNSNNSEHSDIFYLYEALEKLSNNEKECIALFELSGFSIKEIAEMKSFPISTVKTHLSRGRKNLIRLLNPKNETIN
jgi:RNA polymerase sigma-70 factor (ECF subfamily)